MMMFYIHFILLMIIEILLMEIGQQASIDHLEPSDPKYWQNSAIEKISKHKSQNRLGSINENLSNKAKNVIVFIGDGMGVSTITASRILKSQLPFIELLQKQQKVGTGNDQRAIEELFKKLELSEDGYLSFESFESVALVKTYILDSQVGDSGACATAIMSGTKANFETVGVSGKVKLNDCESSIKPEARIQSLVDWAQQHGKSTGFVTTTRITHATPAALYAHSASRYWENDERISNETILCKDIARQLFEDEPGKNLNVIMGGGKRNLISGLKGGAGGGKRQDGRNLIETWLKDKMKRGLNSKFISNRKNLLKLDTSKVDYLLGIFADNHMAHEADRDQSDNGEPSLAEMTIKSLEVLKHNPNGFFLMVESGRIDHAHHLNNAYRALTDTLALDHAVEQALENINLSNTLVIVTADHSHVFTFGGFPARGNLILGIDNQISDIDQLPYTTVMYSNGPGYQKSRQNLSTYDTVNRDYIQQSAVAKRWETHGGEDVPIYATGPGSEIFSGVIDQTFIPYGISYASCIGPMNKLFCGEQKKRDHKIIDHHGQDQHHHPDRHHHHHHQEHQQLNEDNNNEFLSYSNNHITDRSSATKLPPRKFVHQLISLSSTSPSSSSSTSTSSSASMMVQCSFTFWTMMMMIIIINMMTVDSVNGHCPSLIPHWIHILHFKISHSGLLR